MEKIAKIYTSYFIPCYLGLLLFVAPIAVSHILVLGFFFVSFCVFLLDFLSSLGTKTSFCWIDWLFGFGFLLFLSINLVSPFRDYGILIPFAYLLLIWYFYVHKKSLVQNDANYRKFLIILSYVCFAFVLLYFALWKFTKIGWPLIPASTDQNSCVQYILFLLCFTLFLKQYFLSIGLSLIVVFCGSRLGFVALGIIFCFFILSLLWKGKPKFSFGFVFFLFLLSFAFMFLFSAFWSYFSSTSSVAAYKTSLNDTSNASRFSSDFYFLTYAVEHPWLIFFGFNSSLTNYFGISLTNFTDSLFVNGVRIVQPHFSFLNMWLRYGLIYSLLYYGFISFFVSKYLNKVSLGMFCSVVFSGLIMHSLMNEESLLLFLLLLAYANMDFSPRKVSSPTAVRYTKIAI
jgi:hypothetical protein